VVSESLLILHILEAVFTDPKFGLFSIVLREWRKVPCINLKVPNLDLVHIFYFCDLKMKVTLIKMRKQMDNLFKTILMENTIKIDYLSMSIMQMLPLLTASCSFSRAAVVGSISA